MKGCPYCGVLNDDDRKFCSACLRDIADTDITTGRTPPKPKPAPGQGQSRNARRRANWRARLDEAEMSAALSTSPSPRTPPDSLAPSSQPSSVLMVSGGTAKRRYRGPVRVDELDTVSKCLGLAHEDAIGDAESQNKWAKVGWFWVGVGVIIYVLIMVAWLVGHAMSNSTISTTTITTPVTCCQQITATCTNPCTPPASAAPQYNTYYYGNSVTAEPGRDGKNGKGKQGDPGRDGHDGQSIKGDPGRDGHDGANASTANPSPPSGTGTNLPLAPAATGATAVCKVGNYFAYMVGGKNHMGDCFPTKEAAVNAVKKFADLYNEDVCEVVAVNGDRISTKGCFNGLD